MAVCPYGCLCQTINVIYYVKSSHDCSWIIFRFFINIECTLLRRIVIHSSLPIRYRCRCQYCEHQLSRGGGYRYILYHSQLSFNWLSAILIWNVARGLCCYCCLMWTRRMISILQTIPLQTVGWPETGFWNQSGPMCCCFIMSIRPCSTAVHVQDCPINWLLADLRQGAGSGEVACGAAAACLQVRCGWNPCSGLSL